MRKQRGHKGGEHGDGGGEKEKPKNKRGKETKKANYEKGQMVLGCYTSMTALCNYAYDMIKIFNAPEAWNTVGIVNYSCRYNLTRPPALQAYLAL